jgi:hypothetical protein
MARSDDRRYRGGGKGLDLLAAEFDGVELAPQPGAIALLISNAHLADSLSYAHVADSFARLRWRSA